MNTRVLVVDDEPLARRKLASLIESVTWAVRIDEAADGTAAIESVERWEPDIVFLDIQMPELSGIEVVERLRSFDSTPAVVFTTAYAEHAVAAFELQAVDYLLKPFGEDRFLIALERAYEAVRRGSAPAALERASFALTAADGAATSERVSYAMAMRSCPCCFATSSESRRRTTTR